MTNHRRLTPERCYPFCIGILAPLVRSLALTLTLLALANATQPSLCAALPKPSPENDKNGGHAHGHGHAHGSRGNPTSVEPAAQFKAGHGLRLNAKAKTFIDFATTEVETRNIGATRGVAAVPETALLRTVRGTFVFVANGDWLLRTPVKTGDSSAGWVSILEGLYEGDTVVARGARALWLAEIQAVNGGVGCADGH